MAIGSPQWMYSSGASDFTIDQSLRFNDDDSANLSWTPSSASNQKTWTFSCWLKIGNLSNEFDIFSASPSGAESRTVYRITTGDILQIGFNPSGSSWYWLNTTQVFRDTSSWYNFVLAFDSTQAVAANRTKIYVNGEQITDFSTEQYVAQNDDAAINSTEDHYLGRYGGGSNYSDGYLAEVHHIDGTALTPTSFGETGDYGEWKPIEVSGLTYGTNGFYLPFKQDYTVEGFSATVYTGNNSGQYIGGVGFQPDLTWFKRRDASTSYAVNDSVRGIETILTLNTTAAEVGGQDAGDDLLSWETDGFVLGLNGSANSHGRNNGSGNSYVAWNWDMGGDSYGVPSTIEVGGNTNHSTTQEKIGDTSIRFDGTDDYLAVPDSSDWDFGTNDFTIEGWVRFDATGSSEMLFSRSDERVGSSFRTIYIKKDTDDTLITRYGSGGSWVTSENKSTETFATNTWYHIAVTRQNDSFSTYLNGTRLSSMDETSTVDIQGDTPFLFGANYGSSWGDEFTGYMDEIRISNKCRYTSNFTAPTTAFSNDANTTLLIHSDTTNGSTTFVDSSGATKNTGGSITSYVAANATYGQSIVSYEGNGTNGATVGHGLSSAPELIIAKEREIVEHWTTGSDELGWGNVMWLNRTNASTAATWAFNSTAPSSTLITLGSGGGINSSGKDMIVYAFHSVTGYSKFGSYSGNGSSTGTVVNCGFAPAFVVIKRTDATANWYMYDNTREPEAEKGKALYPNLSNAESGDYERLKFTSTGFQLTHTDTDLNGSGGTYIYMAFADKREYAYWLDQSGNNNDWTSNNLTESDISVDSPTNNFATMNPLDKASGTAIYSEGNLKVSVGDNEETFGSFGIEKGVGKYYFEVCHISSASSNNKIGVGIGSAGVTANDEVVDYGHSGTTWGVGTIIGVAVNSTAEEVSFYKNNVIIGSAVDFSGKSWSHWKPIVTSANSAGEEVVTLNFGQDSSFAGTKTAQGNQDSNDIGDFYYTPPTDFLALCTSNLPAVAVTPSEHFNAVIYTGDGDGSSKTITGVGFQPDFIWIKDRSHADDHNLSDAIRGVTKNLFSNTTGAEATDTESIQSFDSNGFTVGNANNINNDHPYVAWNWKANGSGSANTTGSINSTVSVNTDAGFSIVSYTGNGTNPATVGHGLSSAPEMIIIKKRDVASDWTVYHAGVASDAETDFMELNTTNAVADDVERWNDTAPTSAVWTMQDRAEMNGSGGTFIAYCFHSVDGYSKVGTYTGNANVDGTFVYTGFRPAYTMIKKSSGTGGWVLFDNKRATYNVIYNRLQAESTGAEQTDAFGGGGIDFTSNGFKLRESSAYNDASTFIYLAFAETPFKYSNAR